MHIILTLWIAWGIVAAITLALYGYRASLTRDEEGQIFLDEAFDHEKAIQSTIVSRVNRIEPVVRTSVALTALLTAAVIAYYAWDAAKSLFG
jgi:sensor domain CHASE-containing protein